MDRLRDILPKYLLFRTMREELCEVCGDLIRVHEEVYVDLTNDEYAKYYHVKCSGLNDEQIRALRVQDAEFKRQLEEYLGS